MRQIIRLFAFAFIILAGFACYYCGMMFLATGNDHTYFWLHVAFAVYLLWYLPKFICGDRYSPFPLYALETAAGFAWMVTLMLRYRTLMTPINEMGQNELLFLDAGMLLVSGMLFGMFFREE